MRSARSRIGGEPACPADSPRRDNSPYPVSASVPRPPEGGDQCLRTPVRRSTGMRSTPTDRSSRLVPGILATVVEGALEPAAAAQIGDRQGTATASCWGQETHQQRRLGCPTCRPQSSSESGAPWLRPCPPTTSITWDGQPARPRACARSRRTGCSSRSSSRSRARRWSRSPIRFARSIVSAAVDEVVLGLGHVAEVALTEQPGFRGDAARPPVVRGSDATGPELCAPRDGCAIAPADRPPCARRCPAMQGAVRRCTVANFGVRARCRAPAGMAGGSSMSP